MTDAPLAREVFRSIFLSVALMVPVLLGLELTRFAPAWSVPLFFATVIGLGAAEWGLYRRLFRNG